jgi:hypothetical protein
MEAPPSVLPPNRHIAVTLRHLEEFQGDDLCMLVFLLAEERPHTLKQIERFIGAIFGGHGIIISQRIRRMTPLSHDEIQTLLSR